MKYLPTPLALILSLLVFATVTRAEVSTGHAPEIIPLTPQDVSWALEAKLPDLEKPYISISPEDKKDGIVVGTLGTDGGDTNAVLKFAEELNNPPKTENAGTPKESTTGTIDSLLIWYKGKLISEAYYRHGRANYPHYQMSITKSYTALAIGRAMQLGYLKMEDLDKPVIGFLKQLDTNTLAPGSDTITLAQVMEMNSGIRSDDAKTKELLQNPSQIKGQGDIQAYLQYNSNLDPNAKDQLKNPSQLKGQGEIQAYLQCSSNIPPPPRQFKYQEADPAITMQVLNAVAPEGAKDFLQNQLLKPLGITNYVWENSVSDLPKSAAGSSILSRDMLKVGMLIMNKGKWQDQQLIPEAYIARATGPNVHSYGPCYYGFFWWVEDVKVGEKTYHCIEGRGAGGQFIFMFPELDLIAVATSHDKGMGNLLAILPQALIPAFVGTAK